MQQKRVLAGVLTLALLPAAAGRLAAQMQHTMPMPAMVEPLGVSMDRMGSGTTWIPEAAPLPSRHFMAGGWELMLHGFVFGQYDKQGGDRGGSQVGSLNWGMFMASHALAGGRFQARTMLSLDPWTVTPRGYPLLLQTGETYHGEPLHDRQHPHDFWMELGAMYERAITKRVGVSLYVAPSGEPALGPVAFMHRPSAMDNPAAPLGHHWQDATHISYGVVTAGIFGHDWKLEGSVFNGREPDENRWDFNSITLDSYAGRLSFNPSAHWSLTAGYGYLKSPEALDPDEPVRRVTASVLHGTKIGETGQWASALVFGRNEVGRLVIPPGGFESGRAWRPSNSLLMESEAVLDSRNTVLARGELVTKTAEDLSLEPAGGVAFDRTFTIGALSLGYVREVVRLRGATVGIGAMGTLNVVPDALRDTYGSRTPLGSFLFLRLRPTFARPMSMGEMHMQ